MSHYNIFFVRFAAVKYWCSLFLYIGGAGQNAIDHGIKEYLHYVNKTTYCHYQLLEISDMRTYILTSGGLFNWASPAANYG